MIFTKRFISYFLCLCLVFNCIFPIFASNLPDIDITSSSESILGTFNIQGSDSSSGSYSSVGSFTEYLPMLGHTPAGYQISSYANPTFSIYNYSGNFNGYYSLYICLQFFSTGNQSDISATQLNTLRFLNIEYNGRYISPTIQISSTYDNNSDYLPVNPNYYFIKTVWLKYDFYIDNDKFFLEALPYGGVTEIQLTRTSSTEYWICALSNFSLVKYSDQSQYDNSDNLQSIATNIASINSSLSTYIPQIVTVLNSIYSETNGINYFLNHDVSDYIDYVEYYLDQYLINISDNTNDILYQLSTNTRTTIYWMLYQLTLSLTNQGANTENTFYRLLFSRPNGVYYFDMDPTDPDDPGDIFYGSFNGLLRQFWTMLNSIDMLLFSEWRDKQSTLNSAEYQAGQAVSDNISSNGGFGTLSNFSSSASGFGNISLIGNIFNGLGSAFRWFSTQTKNNLDNVPTSRRHNDIVTNYYQSGLEEAESYLYATTESNTESSD